MNQRGATHITQTRMIIIQATPFCNINCSYCYLPNRDDKSRITHATIDRIVERLIEWGRFAPQVTVVWHAGEPLVMDASFFSDAFAQLNRLEAQGLKISHAIQTNATLVTEEHCAVFCRFRTTIGVSIDGPQHIHDAFRKTRSGHNTYKDTVAGIRKFQSASIFPSAIAVLSKLSMENPKEFYDSFTELKIPYVGLNVQEVEGINKVTFFDDPDMTDELYKSFLRSIFILSLRDGTVKFRELVRIVELIRHGKFEGRNSEATPGHILSFSQSGNFSTYSPELLTMNLNQHGWIERGHVEKCSIEASLYDVCCSPLGMSIRNGVFKCRSECDYFPVCGGGSPSNKLAELGRADVTETAYCRYTQKLLLDVVLDLLTDQELRALAVLDSPMRDGLKENVLAEQ